MHFVVTSNFSSLDPKSSISCNILDTNLHKTTIEFKITAFRGEAKIVTNHLSFRDPSIFLI